jgi:DNA adenine methylase
MPPLSAEEKQVQINCEDLISTPKPFLRWAGGKRWLLPVVKEILRGLEPNRYHEPFLGGAAVFLGLPISGPSFLSDLNLDLMRTYEAVRNAPTDVFSVLSKFRNSEEDYYELRAMEPNDSIEAAARFIFLNHTSFNGLYRVNRQGRYNVPYGHSRQPNIPSLAHLKEVSLRLKAAKLSDGDFTSCVSNIGAGDLVFIDPPYSVTEDGRGFVKYNPKTFSFSDQERLSAVVTEIRERGAFFILTNAAHESIAKLFDNGVNRITVYRKNAIGGLNASRGIAPEFLFTNLDV